MRSNRQGTKYTTRRHYHIPPSKHFLCSFTRWWVFDCLTRSQIKSLHIFTPDWSKVKVKFSRCRPKQALGDPVLRLRIFSTFGTMKVVRSSPLRTGRLYLQEFSMYSFLKAESTPGHMVPSVGSEKLSIYTTGDRSRDPPTSSAVP